MSFIDELKRRNVIRVATAYIVVGWLLLQVADVVLDFTEAPAWIGKVLIALLLIGFAVALVLSWLFDATPEGVRRDDGVSGVDPVRAQRLNILTVIAALGVAAMFTWQQVRGPVADQNGTQVSVARLDNASAGSADDASPVPAVDPASIAVLPFADLSPGADQEYFSDGIAEEILNVLVRVNGLAVASRTSAFGFKGQQGLDIPAIGAALNVRYVLEGSVRSAGDTIRITAQLIDAATDKHLWSQTYDRKLTAETVFSIQDEIASAIVAELSKSLPIAAADVVSIGVQADTQNLDAYQLFLRGRQRFRVRSVDNIPATIEILQRAVELDPGFARAWAALSAILTVAPSWGHPGDGIGHYARAKQAADRAIALDDSLALPYAVLANNIGRTGERDYARVFDLYAEALKRDPNEVNALLWRGIEYSNVGFFDEAIADLRRCLELDAAYDNCRVFETEALLFKGDYAAMRESLLAMVGSNSPSQASIIALGLVGKEDALTVQLALAWAFEAFDRPLKPSFVYRAMTDPDFDVDEAYRDFVLRQQELTGETPDLTTPGNLLPLVLGRFELMTPSDFEAYWWHPRFPAFLASPHRKRLIREMGIDDYWRARGFPPQCRPVGDDDFECD